MNKVPVFEWFYAQGDVLVTVNTALETVDVPANLKRQEMVDFILGEVPTPKLSFGEDGIRSSMRFSGKLHNCYFPWESIIQISSQDAVIQFRNNHAQPDQPVDTSQMKHAKRKKTGRPNLRVVK